ncbi:MAG: glycosyltransferase [Acidobacteriaceae bacterium]|nr:glycosyltransferase [Acidobacteriaceae bacterium]
MRLFWLIFAPAIAYQLLAIVAGLRHLTRWATYRPSNFRPGVSVLKPVRGMDPNIREAFASQIAQQYPEFEILFGVRDESDPAAAEIHRLRAAHPEAPVRLITGADAAANGKVGVLMRLSEHARYPVWVVNDSDIKVTPEYLTQVVSPLEHSSIGVVTCPYRAMAHTAPAAWESLGIATDFIPSALVAQLLGVREFGFGSTLAFRAADLVRAGGFRSVAAYIADDYQLAKRLTSLGKRALLSTYTVETSLGQDSWSGVWMHQLRWARTIRASKPGGHAGLPIAHAGVWLLLALTMGAWVPAAVLAATRMLAAFIASAFVTRSRMAAFCWLAPAWDLYSFAVWAASYAGWEVRWRDSIMVLDAQGRIQSCSQIEQQNG